MDASPVGANIDGMAVSVTLVFACEAHREAWLARNGAFDGAHGEAKRADYERRKANTSLLYLVGVEHGAALPVKETPP